MSTSVHTFEDIERLWAERDRLEQNRPKLDKYLADPEAGKSIMTELQKHAKEHMVTYQDEAKVAQIADVTRYRKPGQAVIVFDRNGKIIGGSMYDYLR
jgi:hypothetical protein